ncbi:MAG: hypothetical protein EA417_01900 [Gammaproteobacteria bacterium]|nr:MAG: hypothetical protein EA417_01900 [Gammaproteobacteria bacterium]
MSTTAKHQQGTPIALLDSLEKIQQKFEQKKARQAQQLLEQGYTPELVRELEAEAKPRDPGKKVSPHKLGRGATSARLIEQAQLQLFEGEQRGDFKQFNIEPNSEYPSLLARVPVFAPGQRSKMAARLDKDLAMHFETGWGKGRKFGPPLTIYDEDTLLAILGLRQRQLVGVGSKMPMPVMHPGNPAEETNVQVVFTTIGEIQEFLGLTKGGSGHNRRLASVKRLAGVVIEFTRASDPAMNSVIKGGSFSTKIIDLVTQDLEKESCLYIQLPPVMVKWLSHSYTYIEMDVRRHLTDHGKAIHKFLASQRNFNVTIEKLKEITGSLLPKREFVRVTRQTMKTLQSIGWCEYSIDGNGRSKPLVLKGSRLPRRGASQAASRDLAK